ncbi:MAG: hypothetical protein WKG00_26465 [Polyangiaceae bacterium]
MTRLSLVLSLSSVLLAACGSDEGGDGDTSAGSTSGDPGAGSGDPGSGSGATGSTGDPGSSSGDPGSGATGSGGADPTGSSNGGAGTGGTGTGGSGPSGACTNAADNTILTSTDVEGIVEQCATDSFGAEPATKDCITAGTGLSDPCVTCFDDTVQCTVMKCIGDCFGGMTPECTACMDANCTPAFEACSGLDQ